MPSEIQRSQRTRGFCVLLALGVLAAAPSAGAQSLTMPFKGTYVSTVEIRGYVGNGSCSPLYAVPAGKFLAVTDLLLDTLDASAAQRYQYLCSGPPSASTTPRTAYFTAPDGTSLTKSFQTSIKVKGGESLYACNYSGVSNGLTAWSLGGFLYTP